VDKTFNAKELAFKDLRAGVSAFVKEAGRRRTEWKIFETSGTAAGQKTAFGLLTFGANLSVVGYTMDSVEVRLSNLMAFHATAQGNWGCTPEYYPPVVDLVLSGKVKVGPFAKTFPLDSINEVFEQVHHHQVRERPVMVP
jgi:6-hydroxycyclohex-1-ene-1-carbonyl-CoA dehydrogenase